MGETCEAVAGASSQRALANMALFPGIMLVFYIALIAYFRSRGGYKAIVLATPGEPERVPDEKFTGGVKGPVR